MMIEVNTIPDCKSVLSITGGPLPDKTVRVSTNTKEIKSGDLFICLKGDRFDAFGFIEDIVERGARIVVYIDEEGRSEVVKKYSGVSFIAASNTILFLQELATLHVTNWQKLNRDREVFAICGSNGKTTHKEILAHVLSRVAKGKFVITKSNNNNHIGVPLTLLDLDLEKHDIVVVELGSNHPGEIRALCEIARPTSGIVTNIGHTHMEFFHTLDNVFKEEGYLFTFLKEQYPKGFFFIINDEDDHLKQIEALEGNIRVGVGDECDIQYRYSDNEVVINHGREEVIIKNENLLGRHNLQNLANSYLIAEHFFPDKKTEIVRELCQFRSGLMRSEWRSIAGKEIYLDAYNANPSSMKIALIEFKKYLDRQSVDLKDILIVIGDMKELGESTKVHHKQLGELIKSLGVANIIYIGSYYSWFEEGYGDKVKSFEKVEEALPYFFDHNAKYVFVKGSRSLQLEKIVAIN